MSRIVINSQRLYDALHGDVYNPYLSCSKKYKGALHVHTTNSDGVLSPAEMVELHKQKGYHFLVFTDHNYITDGSPHTTSTFLAFGGVEDNGRFDDHLLGIGDLTNYPSNPEIQEDHGYEAWNRGDAIVLFNGIPVIAHPHYMSVNLYEALHIRSQPKMVELMDIPISQSYWDHMLNAGQLVYGICTDDSHRAEHVGYGFVVVCADYLSKREIMDRLLTGSFYSVGGSGDVLDLNVDVQNRDVYVNVPGASRIWGITSNGLVSIVRGDSIRYRVRAGDGYVRFVAQHPRGRVYTNPFIDFTHFSKLDKTWKWLSSLIKYASTRTLNITNNTNSTSWVRFTRIDIPEHQMWIINKIVMQCIQNCENLRVKLNWIGYRPDSPGEEIAVPGTLIVDPGGVIHARKRFEMMFRTTDSTKSVTLSVTLYVKIVHMKSVLAYNRLV